MTITCTGLLAVQCFILPVFAAPSIADMQELHRQEVYFDFCGIDSGIGRRDSNTGISPKRIEMLVDYGCDNYESRMAWLDRAQRMERSLRYGSAEDISNVVDEASSALIDLKRSSEKDVKARYAMLDCIERLEYALARSLNFSSNATVSADCVVKLLPDPLFRDKGAQEAFALRKMLVFRNLLAIGFRIRSFLHEHRRYPADLGELEGIEAYAAPVDGMEVCYSVKDGTWQLFCGGRRIRKEMMIFDNYVPMLRGHPEYKWPYSGAVWLSSSYSAKRRMLYCGEVVNANTPWACKMEDGRVIKPDARPAPSGRSF